jgi:hypothetical protein
VLVGANPGLQLFDEAGACTAYASVWQVDWSVMGSGAALVLWRPGSVTVFGEDPLLAHHLAESYVRHFPELAELPWHTTVFVDAPVEIDIDLASGVTAAANDVVVSISDVLDRRAFATDEFPLAEVEHSLSLVLGPCGSGAITVGGEPVAGKISRGGSPERPQSSAFIAIAEVWRR